MPERNTLNSHIIAGGMRTRKYMTGRDQSKMFIFLLCYFVT